MILSQWEHPGAPDGSFSSKLRFAFGTLRRMRWCRSPWWVTGWAVELVWDDRVCLGDGTRPEARRIAAFAPLP